MMEMLRTSLLSGVSATAKLLSGFFLMKIIALYAGPVGVAQFGQFINFATLIFVLGGGGILPGVIKYVAEFNSNNKGNITPFISSSLSYVLIFTILTAALLFALSGKILNFLNFQQDYLILIYLLAIIQIFMVVHNLTIAVNNGMMDISRIVKIQVIGALLNVSLVFAMMHFFKMQGALIGYLIGQGAMLFISLYYLSKSDYFNRVSFRPRFNFYFYKLLVPFSLMTITSATLGPGVKIIVINIISDNSSLTEAGYWQAVSRTSDAYLFFFTTAISVYYLPKLSALSLKRDLLGEIYSGYFLMLPVAAIIASFIYIFRDSITILLYSREFLAANDLFAPQLIGDLLKVSSFILSYFMIAKAMTAIFILSELIFSATYVALVYTLVELYGTTGAMYAYVLNYFAYFLFCAFVVFNYLRRLR